MKKIPENFNSTEHNGTVARNLTDSNFESEDLKKTFYYLIILICISGIVGNGIVIKFLGFWIKRTPFTVYILNLAVADSGSLIFLFLTGILTLSITSVPTAITACFIFTYCTGQFLLTIISIDRCLALFFPIWHRCHQPPYLSTILCALSWILSILFCVIYYTLNSPEQKQSKVLHILIFTSVGLLLMVASSLALLIKGYLKSRMKRRGKLLTAILLALFFFLIFSFPPVVIYLIVCLGQGHHLNLLSYGYVCPCLNSSVNPLIYFLLGRKKEHHSPYNLKINLQTLFKEEEESKEQPEVPVGSLL
uniref:G-protein coupled receptors family 1 profile domain-containing protein n=1 Tax=Naja naja TaxID=35670 RepID=A0A8C6XAD1_NAJNA